MGRILSGRPEVQMLVASVDERLPTNDTTFDKHGGRFGVSLHSRVMFLSLAACGVIHATSTDRVGACTIQ